MSGARQLAALGERARRWDRRAAWWIGALTVAYAVLVIGPPLWGAGVFAGTDALNAPERTYWLGDTIDAAIPQVALFGAALRAGHWLSWNPYIAGGVPLGAVPNVALGNPLTWPFLVLPGWLAPAWTKVLEIACGVGGCWLFLRRIRLGRAAALLGGLVFASSGFMVVWSNWPQTRVAAFIPALFWTVERAVQRRRLADALPIGLVVAAMLLGGFPAITGYALYTATGYLLVRLVAAYRRALRQAGRVLAGAAGGLALGFGLAAWQLVPFAVFMHHAHAVGRGQTASDMLPRVTLLTAVAPWALGSNTQTNPPPYFFAASKVFNNNNVIEAMAYLGCAALVLGLYAFTRLGAARRSLPGGVFLYFCAALACWITVCYFSAPAHGLLLHLPVFGNNFIGRARSVLGFLAAVLVATGYHLVAQPDGVPGRRRVRPLPVLAGVGVLAALVSLWHAALHLARHSAQAGDVAARVASLDRQVLLAAALLVAATALVVAARRLTGSKRAIAVALLPVLVLGQALTVTTSFLPRPSRSTYYPSTDLTSYLAANLGDDRMATGLAMRSGTQTAYRLRALDGHSYVDQRMVDLLDAVPGFTASNNTTLRFDVTQPQATSPVLDRLGVRYFVATPVAPLIGTVEPAPAATAPITLQSGQTLTVPIPGTGPLRGLLLSVMTPVRYDDMLTVTLADPAGTVVGEGQWAMGWRGRPDAPGARSWLPINVPIAGEDIVAGTPVVASITYTGRGSLSVAGSADGVPAVGVVRPAADGLRLVYAHGAAVYQRLAALPRIRWASNTVTIPDTAGQVAAVASGQTPADTVILDRPGEPASGQPAQVQIVRDAADGIEVRVHAQGAGYLVVADNLLVGWAATMDGKKAHIATADHAVGAVFVPAGTHTVRLRYASPAGGAGTRITLLTLLFLLFAGAVAARSAWQRRIGVRSGQRGRARPRLGEGVRHVDHDRAGDGVHRAVPAPCGNRSAGRDRRPAVLQRGGSRPGGD